MSVYRIGDIEDAIYEIFAPLKANIYASTPPGIVSDNDKTNGFIVIDIGTINSYGAYDKTILNLFLYAPTLDNGLKNVSLLNHLDISTDVRLRAKKGRITTGTINIDINELYKKQGYNSTYSMHYIIKALNLIIS